MLWNLAFQFESLQMLSAPLMPWRFDALEKESGSKWIEEEEKIFIFFPDYASLSSTYQEREKDPDEFKESWKLCPEGEKNNLCVR